MTDAADRSHQFALTGQDPQGRNRTIVRKRPRHGANHKDAYRRRSAITPATLVPRGTLFRRGEVLAQRSEQPGAVGRAKTGAGVPAWAS